MAEADDQPDVGRGHTAATAHGERSRRALLSAAEERYRSHGYEATRLADITSDAELTTGSLYRHFTGKDDILAVLFDEHRARLDHALDSAASLASACSAWIELGRAHRGLLRSAQETLRPRQPQTQRWSLARDGWEQRMAKLLPARLVGPSRTVAAAIIVDGLEYYTLAETSGWFEARDPDHVGGQIEQLVRDGMYDAPIGDASPSRAVLAGVQLDRTYFSWSVSDNQVLPASGRGQKTWDRIREAATEVFATLGFRAATVADIAEAAGVSSATIYRYFEDKEDLLLNLLTATEHELVERRMYQLDAAGRHPVQEVYEGFMQLHRDRAGVFLAWSELNTPGSTYERAWIDLHDILMTQMVKVWRSGQRNGLITKNLDVQLMTEFYGSIHERSAYARVALGRELGVTDRDVGGMLAQLYNGGLS
jgi:AcrR family transcriptional regulator